MSISCANGIALMERPEFSVTARKSLQCVSNSTASVDDTQLFLMLHINLVCRRAIADAGTLIVDPLFKEGMASAGLAARYSSMTDKISGHHYSTRAAMPFCGSAYLVCLRYNQCHQAAEPKA